MAQPQCLNCQAEPAALIATSLPSGDTQQLCAGCMVGWLAWMVKQVFDVDLLPPSEGEIEAQAAQEAPDDATAPTQPPKRPRAAKRTTGTSGRSSARLSAVPMGTDGPEAQTSAEVSPAVTS